MQVITQIRKWLSSRQLRRQKAAVEKTGLVKIAFEYPSKDGVSHERVWAKPISENLYQIENIPVFVSGYNLHDIVHCEGIAAGVPLVKELFQFSGNKTLRIVFPEDIAEEPWGEVMGKLRSKGVTWERVVGRRYVLNIPPQTDFIEVRDFLRQKEAQDKLRLYEDM
jgi:hypothetical protein